MQSRFHDYSYRNTLLIQRQCPGATRVAGYQTWREEFDRQVSKGESAIWIWAPIVTRRCPECENGRSWHERRGCEYDAMPPSEWERALVGFKPVPVFDVSQTDGEALPELDTRTTSDGDASGIFARLLDAASDLGVDASVVAPEEWTHGAADGACTETPRGSQVRVEVLENENAVTMASVLAHEYAHALLHSDVEDAGERAKRELEAESVAYVVSRYLGLDASRSALYVAAWHREPADAIRDRLERIVDTTRGIIDAVEAASTIP